MEIKSVSTEGCYYIICGSFIEILFVTQNICYCDGFNSKAKQKNQNVISFNRNYFSIYFTKCIF